mmetsp:Transcript_25278/g.31152  ORF Transcript_25278/g.31152 Transcript_25278/m.31152 type:complete len:415 (+) Transcript_25278:75-1319(+)
MIIYNIMNHRNCEIFTNLSIYYIIAIIIVNVNTTPTKAFGYHLRHNIYKPALTSFVSISTSNQLNIQRQKINVKPFQIKSHRDIDADYHHQEKTFLNKVLSRFQGDFDNYYQVYNDRQNGLFPREGGGHEHFHVTLIPTSNIFDFLPNDMLSFIEEEAHSDEKDSITKTCGGAVIAAYYFDGMPNRIFRLRMYTFYSNIENDESVRMKLYTFNPELEAKLRQSSQNSLDVWVSIIEKYIKTNIERHHSNVIFTELKRCDIKWTEKTDQTRHTYFDYESHSNDEQNNPENACHAIMINDHDIGGVLLESQMTPGSFIRVQDELSLWENELWVNDRGHDAESGIMVYGNYLKIPYKMRRVSTLTSVENLGFKWKRNMVDETLSWTLGDDWRTSEKYESKMNDIGGVSTMMNKQKKA